MSSTAAVTLASLSNAGRSVVLVPGDGGPAFQRWDDQGNNALYYDPQTDVVGTFDDHLLVGLSPWRLVPVTVT